MIESLELRNQQPDEKAHDVHKWEIHSDGQHVGHLWVAGSKSPFTNYGAGSPEHASHLTISVYPLSGQPSLKLGYQGARDLVQHLAQIYPSAVTVGGERKTGTHSKQDWPFTRIRLDQAHARNSREAYKQYMTPERQEAFKQSIQMSLDRHKSEAAFFLHRDQLDESVDPELTKEGYKLSIAPREKYDLENHPYFEHGSHHWSVRDDHGLKLASLQVTPRLHLPYATLSKNGIIPSIPRVRAYPAKPTDDPDEIAKTYGWHKTQTTDSGEHFEHHDHPGHEIIVGDNNWTHCNPEHEQRTDDEGYIIPMASGQNFHHRHRGEDASMYNHLKSFHGKPLPTYNHLEIDVNTNEEHPTASSKPETDAGPKFDMGMHMVRHALRHFAKVYPHALTFGGSRTTGVTAGSIQTLHRDQIMRGIKEKHITGITIQPAEHTARAIKSRPGTVPFGEEDIHHVFDQDNKHVATISLYNQYDADHRSAVMTVHAMADRSGPFGHSWVAPTLTPTYTTDMSITRRAIKYIADTYPKLQSVGGERKTGTSAKWHGGHDTANFDLNLVRARYQESNSSGEVVMSRAAFRREHHDLVRVLRSGSHKEREREANDQEAELRGEAQEGVAVRPCPGDARILERSEVLREASYATVQVATGRNPVEVLGHLLDMLIT